MRLYKATGISGVAAFVFIVIALYLNPMRGKSIAPSMVKNGSLIAALIMIAVFLVLFVVTLIHHKVESKNTGGMRAVFDPGFNVFASAGKYDEDLDSTEKTRENNKETHKFD